ncbi:MAG TPA: succinate dehydrogenase/fumarate reductase iron-sulfur subunit [Gammaproteobacteria bacterium]|nr:succinate dehydrogenase/fumarate reductase iron-sulfur subunit [Gammaproteobacteria bacterium]
MTERTLRIEIQRYQPEDDEPPYWQGYNVPCEEHWVLLDALNHIKDHLDGTLSYRWSCHMAVCGSCGMVVNGDPMLACKTFVRDLPDTVRVAPLSNLPVERDLIVDQERFMTSLSEVSPWVIPAGTPPEDAEYRQSPQELARFRQYSMCINCLLCYAACPQVGLNPGYLGPAALALAHRYNLDSRDDGRLWRAEVTGSENGVWECTFVGECSEVCPKHVDPAGAIQQMKLANSLDWLTAPLRRKERS